MKQPKADTAPRVIRSTDSPSEVTEAKGGDTVVEDRSKAPGPKPRQTRHAHLFVTHFDLWSVMKNAFMFALAVAIVMIVAVIVIWTMLSLSGTLAAVTRTVTDIFASGGSEIDPGELFPFGRVVGTTALLAAVEVVLVTALVTLFAYLYNLSVGLTGGVQVTLTDDQ